MTNEEYIHQHLTDDVRKLALKREPEGIDMAWCLQQIEGWQLARKKLPRWTKTDGLWFPPRLSMEQCSSEATALYKRGVTQRLLADSQRGHMMDLTGGFGIDFGYMAPLFLHATYVERQEPLCRIARHNLPLLGLGHARIVQADGTGVTEGADLIYLDPARRDDAGRKTVAIEDCTPNVADIQDALLSRARYIIIKYSPMLDITQALRTLHQVSEVHTVSVRGECKELLFVLDGDGDSSTPIYHAANLDTEDETIVCSETERRNPPIISQKEGEEMAGAYLFEPNASILKSGCQDILSQRYGLEKLHPCSNLFLGSTPISHFPGRQFRIDAVSDFSKKGLKTILAGTQQGNLAIRNFPSTVSDLRKKLKLREGGDLYFFATTLSDGTHALLRCVK